MPDVPFSQFFPTCNDNDKRFLFYDFYVKGEAEAKTFVVNWVWWPIQQVLVQQQGQSALWVPDHFLRTATIFLHDGEIVGSVFHEVFHSAFSGSHLFVTNEKWGDAFCNAFQFFMEEKHMPASKILAQVKDRTQQGKEVKMDQAYPDPILENCNKDYEHFKTLWRRLQADPRVSLDTYFNITKTRYWP
jgi:hypothetical protein